MPHAAKIVAVGFEKMGPILSLDKAKLIGNAAPSHQVGQSRIEEDALYAWVYLVVSVPTNVPVLDWMKENALELAEKAEGTYQDEHPGENLVFKNTPSDAGT